MKTQRFANVFLFLKGNCGKAFEVRRSKKNQSKEELRRSREDLTGESRSLLDSEDDLDREEVLNPEPENRSVSAPMRPEPTEYDRLVFAASTQSLHLASVTCHCHHIIGQLLLFLN